MTTRTFKHPSLSTALVAPLFASLALGGCMADNMADEFNDEEVIASALELENGGLDMADEAPMFDEAPLFDEAGEADAVETEVTDELEESPEVQEALGQPDAVLFHTTVMWGQIPGDRENRTPYNWSGALSVNRGAIIVRSVLAFDGRSDRVLPRDNPRVVAFTSATLPHRDGLRLVIVDPTPEADEPLVLTYRQQDGDVFAAAMIDLVGQPQSQSMDDAGNRIVAVAMPQPVDVCQNGFLGGRWHRVEDGRGRILGRVVDAEGRPVGHVRGIYGRRDSGERVFFAKYINRAGQFQGILRGTYGEGHFIGRWMTRDGEAGGVRGEYRETLDGDRVGGHFLGRWAETRCNLDI